MRVVVQTMTGQPMDIALPSNSRVSVLDVKIAIQERCGVPPILQSLLFGTEVLHGSMLLSELQQRCSAADPLILSMVAVFDKAYDALEDSDWSVRRMAAEFLATSTQPHDARLVAMLGARAQQDSDYEVRCAAIDALVRFADEGDEAARQAVLSCHSDACAKVRLAVLRLLAREAQRGEQAAIVAVSERLQDRDILVRNFAADALLPLAQKDDTRAVFAVMPYLRNGCPAVRQVAAQALGKMASQSDQHTISLLVACLRDPVWMVRHSALRALSKLSPDGCGIDVARLSGCLSDSEACVRRAAQELFHTIGQRRADSSPFVGLCTKHPMDAAACPISAEPETPRKTPMGKRNRFVRMADESEQKSSSNRFC